jgi:hypothetical protein
MPEFSAGPDGKVECFSSVVGSISTENGADSIRVKFLVSASADHLKLNSSPSGHGSTGDIAEVSGQAWRIESEQYANSCNRLTLKFSGDPSNLAEVQRLASSIRNFAWVIPASPAFRIVGSFFHFWPKS